MRHKRFMAKFDENKDFTLDTKELKTALDEKVSLMMSSKRHSVVTSKARISLTSQSFASSFNARLSDNLGMGASSIFSLAGSETME